MIDLMDDVIVTITAELLFNAKRFKMNSIKDNSPGISEKDRERVLERFYRVENHSTPGCGIGLSIVMRVVELHNATFKMNTADNGSGLIVSVCFPKQ